MRLIASLAAAAVIVGACGGTPAATAPSPTSTPAPTPTPSPTPQTKFTFLADLKGTNEVPPVANAEAVCSGKGTFTLTTTLDAAGKIASAVGDFEVNVTGCPANTPIILYHIHKQVAGQNGGVVVGGKTDAANPIVLATGATTTPLTTKGVAVTGDVATDIIANPANYYLNVHSTSNPGGVIRSQLSKG